MTTIKKGTTVFVYAGVFDVDEDDTSYSGQFKEGKMHKKIGKVAAKRKAFCKSDATSLEVNDYNVNNNINGNINNNIDIDNNNDGNNDNNNDGNNDNNNGNNDNNNSKSDNNSDNNSDNDSDSDSDNNIDNDSNNDSDNDNNYNSASDTEKEDEETIEWDYDGYFSPTFTLTRTTKNMNHNAFRQELAMALIHNVHLEERQTRSSAMDLMTVTNTHALKSYPHGTRGSEKGRKLRRKCVACKKKVTRYCGDCGDNFPLCVDACHQQHIQQILDTQLDRPQSQSFKPSTRRGSLTTRRRLTRVDNITPRRL
eukprot:Awhi_evm1s12644